MDSWTYIFYCWTYYLPPCPCGTNVECSKVLMIPMAPLAMELKDSLGAATPLSCSSRSFRVKFSHQFFDMFLKLQNVTQNCSRGTQKEYSWAFGSLFSSKITSKWTSKRSLFENGRPLANMRRHERIACRPPPKGAQNRDKM